MAQRIPIQLHVGNALQWLGMLYRSPADALEEHVSNAIDEHIKAQVQGSALDRCDVRFTLDRRQIVIEYLYGMSQREFEAALERVADSAKRADGVTGSASASSASNRSGASALSSRGRATRRRRSASS